MRTTINVLILPLLCMPLGVNTLEESTQPVTAHPRDAALIQRGDGSFSYSHFPSGGRLYVFDGDVPGQSNCTGGCQSAWPPLYVTDDAPERVGYWTVIVRPDGTRQWAYKDQPVYRRFHDLRGPIGTEGFRLLVP